MEEMQFDGSFINFDNTVIKFAYKHTKLDIFSFLEVKDNFKFEDYFLFKENDREYVLKFLDEWYHDLKINWGLLNKDIINKNYKGHKKYIKNCKIKKALVEDIFLKEIEKGKERYFKIGLSGKYLDMEKEEKAAKEYFFKKEIKEDVVATISHIVKELGVHVDEYEKMQLFLKPEILKDFTGVVDINSEYRNYLYENIKFDAKHKKLDLEFLCYPEGKDILVFEMSFDKNKKGLTNIVYKTFNKNKEIHWKKLYSKFYETHEVETEMIETTTPYFNFEENYRKICNIEYSILEKNKKYIFKVRIIYK